MQFGEVGETENFFGRRLVRFHHFVLTRNRTPVPGRGFKYRIPSLVGISRPPTPDDVCVSWWLLDESVRYMINVGTLLLAIGPVVNT